MARVAGAEVTLVWRNEVGGLTGRVDGPDPRYIKWNPTGSGESLLQEAERMGWLAGRHPAPRVLEYLLDDEAELLVTAALPGVSAVDERWRDEPAIAIRAVAEGLRRLHSLPTQDCPFEWSVDTRLASAGLHHSPPTIDRLVVCHGDACAPNTVIDVHGRFLANVDFGRLGVADRWADLAVATLSLGWNYGDYDERIFWDAYGIAPDVERIDFYRALWDAA
jgi:kanamycin kinase